MKQMGVGLAAAILIDATLVRAVLLPATMKLLGKRNWYLPHGPAVAAEVRARAAGGSGRGLAAHPTGTCHRPRGESLAAFGVLRANVNCGWVRR